MTASTTVFSGPELLVDVLVSMQVIALLSTCGSYFNKGSAKRRLDRFFTFLQAYVLAKDLPPLDIDADLQVRVWYATDILNLLAVGSWRSNQTFARSCQTMLGCETTLGLHT